MGVCSQGPPSRGPPSPEVQTWAVSVGPARPRDGCASPLSTLAGRPPSTATPPRFSSRLAAPALGCPLGSPRAGRLPRSRAAAAVAAVCVVSVFVGEVRRGPSPAGWSLAVAASHRSPAGVRGARARAEQERGARVAREGRGCGGVAALAWAPGGEGGRGGLTSKAFGGLSGVGAFFRSSLRRR